MAKKVMVQFESSIPFDYEGDDIDVAMSATGDLVVSKEAPGFNAGGKRNRKVIAIFGAHCGWRVHVEED